MGVLGCKYLLNRQPYYVVTDENRDPISRKDSLI